jgi:hypothetical protein
LEFDNQGGKMHASAKAKSALSTYENTTPRIFDLTLRIVIELQDERL